MNAATPMNGKYPYGGMPAEVHSASGVRSIVIRSLDGSLVFRVHHNRDPEHLTGYDIRHDDLSVMIDTDTLSAFYRIREHNILDHSPSVPGLKKIRK